MDDADFALRQAFRVHEVSGIGFGDRYVIVHRASAQTVNEETRLQPSPAPVFTHVGRLDGDRDTTKLR